MMLPFENREFDVVVKKDVSTSFDYGCVPEERSIEDFLDLGVVNVDKPGGPTSHEVSSFVKSILGVKKAGHAGTLDPGVTGCLPVAFSSATRIVQVLLNAGKEYVCLMHVHSGFTREKLDEVFSKFTGEISQLPPVKSAVKRAVRKRTVYYLDVLDVRDRDVLFRVGCQAGTYIRKLVSDMGRSLGGAHMAELRRTKAGPFGEGSLVTLQDLKDAFHYFKEEGSEKFLRKVVLPFESAVSFIPKVYVLDSAVDSLCHGFNLKLPGVVKFDSDIVKGSVVAVMTLKGELIGYGSAVCDSNSLLGGSGVAVRIEKVFMRRGLYPRFKK